MDYFSYLWESFADSNRISSVFFHYKSFFNNGKELINLMYFLHSNIFDAFTFQSEPQVDIAALIAIAGQTVWTFIFIFIYCELGQRVSEEFNGPYDAICQLRLHLFPIEIKRMLPIIILGAQQPIDLRGYGNFSCNRDSFKSVSGIMLCFSNEKNDFMID